MVGTHRIGMGPIGVGLAIFAVLIAVAPSARAAGCAGDCNGDDSVTVDEITHCVRATLVGDHSADTCCDGDRSGDLDVGDILTTVNKALAGCNECWEPRLPGCGPGEACDIRSAGCAFDPQRGGFPTLADSRCVELPDVCPEVYAPVCACN